MTPNWLDCCDYCGKEVGELDLIQDDQGNAYCQDCANGQELSNEVLETIADRPHIFRDHQR